MVRPSSTDPSAANSTGIGYLSTRRPYALPNPESAVISPTLTLPSILEILLYYLPTNKTYTMINPGWDH